MIRPEFKQRILEQNYIDAEALLKALGEPSPVSIRTNPQKWNRLPLDAEPVEWCKNGYYLSSRPSFTSDPLFHSGCYYPQEASGMFLDEAVRQSVKSRDNIRVLDLCGAPGGKSLILADIIGKGSLLIANDVIRSRAAILAETITKWGTGNTIVTQSDPSSFGRLPGYFDIILVDAPCSGEGMFRNIVAVNEWSVENSEHCSERQKRILMDIWPSLKENGLLIYSTCTFNPGENEKNIKWLTDKNEAEVIRLNVSGFNGITEIEYQGIFGYGFYPGKVRGEGFFLSVIKKTGKQENILIRNQKKNEFRPDTDDINVALGWTRFAKESLIKWGDEVIAIPCGIDEYQMLYQNLRIVKAGTRIFVRKKSDYLPSHELALSVHLREEAFPREQINRNDAVSYLRRDNFILKTILMGWNIVTYWGISLGFIKNIGNRINNYFPVEWRIRMNLKEAITENTIKWDIDENYIT
jgi:16S rRNA C967 or C1407 C5-methylase (RsmB/RsmF family)/NOL1/NOP2/fmu family ribosome biogenesis protein